jgi:hypothetical protein
MPVLKRQESLGARVAFTSRLSGEKYKELEDFAWNKRLTLAAAIARLLDKALKAEHGAPYVPDKAADSAGATK